MSTEEHWLGSRVMMIHRSGTNFDDKLVDALYSQNNMDERCIEIAGVKLRCEQHFHSTLDLDLVITHWSPFDGPPPKIEEHGLLRSRGLFGKKLFVRAVVQG
jgi:hypothetical protein